MAKESRRPLDRDEYQVETYRVAPGYKGSEWIKELPKDTPRKDYPAKNKAYDEATVTVRRDVAGQAMAKAAVKKLENGVLTRRHSSNKAPKGN
jgi:hypothetical protein